MEGVQSLAQGVASWVHSCLAPDVDSAAFLYNTRRNNNNKREIHVEIDGDGCGFSVTDIGGVFVHSLERLRLVGGDWHVTGAGESTDMTVRRLTALGVLVRHGLVKVESMQPGRFEALVAVYKKGGELVELGWNDGFERRRQGTRVVVKDWDRGRFFAGVDSEVKDVRVTLQNISLIVPHVTITLYSASSRKFVFKSLGTALPIEKAASFFGSVDADLVAPLEQEEIVDGWKVSGYTVLPPLGHATRSRQRVYVNTRLHTGGEIRKKIDALFAAVYKDHVKLIRSTQHRGDLLSVRKGLNQYPMYVMCLSADTHDADNTFPHGSGIDAMIEATFLKAWKMTLSGKLLKLLDAACRNMYQEDESSMIQSTVNIKQQQRRNVSRLDSFAFAGSGVGNTVVDHFPKRRRVDPTTVLGTNDRDRDGVLPHKREHTYSNNNNNTRQPLLLELSENRKPSKILLPHSNRHSSFFMPVATIQDIENKFLRNIKNNNTERVPREEIRNCKIIGNIEKKFIAYVSKDGHLGLVDQHAADERVRLEDLQSQIFASGDRGKPNTAHVKPWKYPHDSSIHVGDDELPLFDQYRPHAYSWGWRWDPWCPSTKTIRVTHAPCFYGKVLSVSDLKMYVYQLADTKASSMAPMAVHRVLASVACRGAIMFGDVLSMNQMRSLVERLSQTAQYYECAHGRPTVHRLLHVPSLPHGTAVERLGGQMSSQLTVENIQRFIQ